MTEDAGGTHRFRTRLTAAFVLTAAITSGALAVATYGLTREYRQRSFRETSRDEVRVALALAPRSLDEESFERILRVYSTRTASDAVVVDGDNTFSSSSALDSTDVPSWLYDDIADEMRTATTRVAGRDYMVVVGLGPNGEHYAFFFGLDQLHDSLAELRTVLIVSWAAIVVVALAVGEVVARRTLRPVGQAAQAAASIAAGMLHTRIPSKGSDEFAQWARSFNTMAQSLESKVDELDRAAARERQFTADMAHDLRTPLTTLTTMATLLEDLIDTLPADAQQIATALIADTRRLTALVLELLELAQLDAGGEDTQLEHLAIRDLVEHTVSSLSIDGSAGIAVDVPEGLRALTERRHVRRALANLIDNAIRHGGGLIEVSARQSDDAVHVRIRDRGPGIEHTHLERVFDRFFRGDSSRTSGGSGLGLAIAREHALAVGGDLFAENDPHGGAAFTLTLRRASDTDGSTTHPHPLHGV